MSRTLTLSTLTIGLLITALVGVNGVLLTLLIPFFLALSIGIYFAAEELNIEASRTLSNAKLLAGSTLRITVTVTNKGSRIAELHIEDQVPPQLTVTDGDTSLMTSLGAGESITFAYELKGPRGTYSFPMLKVAATDYLGLFWRRDELVVEGNVESLIVPQVDKVDPLAIRPKQTRAFAGYIPARIAGSGIDFFGVREYRPGDSLRHINWKATARASSRQGSDVIFTNEFEQERVTDIGLILDARHRAVVAANTSALLEHEIAAAAAISEAMVGAGNRLSLLIYGNFLNWTLPGYGKVQHQKILQSLSAVKLGTSQVFETLNYLPTKLFPAKSQIILFSTLLRDDVVPIGRMRAQGYSVLVISPDPVSFEYLALPKSAETQLAARVARIERELILRDLRQTGVRVVNWDVRQPISDLVKAKLQRPPQRAF